MPGAVGRRSATTPSSGTLRGGVPPRGERHQNRQAIAEDARAARGAVARGGAALGSDEHAGTPRRGTRVRRASGSRSSAAGRRPRRGGRAALRGSARHASQQRAEEQRAAAERTQRQQLQRVEQLIERATKRAAAEDLTLREADRLARDLRSADRGAAAGADDANSRRRRSSGSRPRRPSIAPRLHDLREMDEWKRFANAAVQEELIARAEALRAKYRLRRARRRSQAEEDLDKAARELHDIQERWKQVAEAPRAQAQALWHRYRQAADPIQARLREFFAHRNEERKGNLDKKLALIARAEALADSTDWIKTADELKKLQAEWQQIGPVPRQDTRATWKQFRDACDRFFTRRNADLAERKETWTANLARKEALCARAEELAGSTRVGQGGGGDPPAAGRVEDHRPGAPQQVGGRLAALPHRLRHVLRSLQAARRDRARAEAGRPRSSSSPSWRRCRRRTAGGDQRHRSPSAACSNRCGRCAPAGTSDAGRPARRRSAQRAIHRRARAALIGPSRTRSGARSSTSKPNRQKMEKLCARVEGFLTDAAPAPANSSQALADMLREALASNTIGGRAGEESKWRAMAEDVRQAQAAWSRLGPVPGDTGRQLTERFHKACNRFFDQYRRKVPPQPSAPRSGGGRRPESQSERPKAGAGSRER